MQPSFKQCPQCNSPAPLEASQCQHCAHQFRTQFPSANEETQVSAQPPQYSPPGYSTPPSYSQPPSYPPPPAPYQPNYPPSPYPPNQPGYPPQPGYAPYETRKDKVVAGLLAFFLGGFGVHGFYLGNTNMGITILVLNLIGIVTSLFLIGIFIIIPISIICLVQAVLYWVSNDYDFHQKYVVEKRWF